RRHREVLPAQTIASRKFAADLPLVLHVGAVLPTAERVTIGSLGHKVISTQRIGSAEQEGRERIVLAGSRAGSGSLARREPESPLRSKVSAVELRLQLVQILFVNVGTEADIVRSTRPRSIGHELILRVIEQIRLEIVRRADGGEVG